jgi:uncharacterized protein YbaR (Trm112 family)
MVDDELLKILCCPETHQPLRRAETEVIERLNREAAEGRLKNRGGQPVVQKLDGGLVREDGHYVYPIRHEIPVLLIDEAIPLAS